jgi:4-hydroxy-2-oxoheptanedioate aldolase
MAPAERESLSKLIRGPSPILGTFMQLGNPTVVEVLGRAGLDFAVIDLEHGETPSQAVPMLVRAADTVGLPLLVRLPRERLFEADQLLDVGCEGLLVARVTTVDQARLAVEASRYPPHGERGSCPGIRSSDHGWLNWPDHVARAESRTVVGVAVEGDAGIAALDDIFGVPGIDFVFVGVFDLSASLGHPGELDHPSVVSAVESVAAKAAHAGVAVATWAPTIAIAGRWLAAGVRVLTVATDVLLWRQACMSLRTDWEALTDPLESPRQP